MKIKRYKYKYVNSTNDVAISLIKKKNIKSGIVISEIQKKGRGRRGKKWISQKGNLFLTIFFSISQTLDINKIIKINLQIINKLINKQILITTSIKQPNDILIKKKKVCGILQEIVFKDNQKYLIIGIGVNLLNSPNINNYATTFLNKYSKKKIYKIQLANKIKIEFEKQYYKFAS